MPKSKQRKDHKKRVEKFHRKQRAKLNKAKQKLLEMMKESDENNDIEN